MAAAVLVGGCGASAVGTGDRSPAMLDALFSGGRRTESLDRLLRSLPLDAGEEFRIEELGRDERTSHHLVWIRHAEVPHRHDRHDLWVVIVQGEGQMRLGAEERAVGEGSILYVPRGTVHAFRNTSGAPAAAYAVYAPAFDGRDRITVRAGDGSSSSDP